MNKNVRNMVLCGLFASLIALCGWISITVPPLSFTMQTFGVLLTLGLLGGSRGFRAVAVYLLLGVVGLPVFASFRGGAGALLDPTGGFLWGFAVGALVYRLTEGLGKLPAMVACQGTIYLCGCLWFSRYAGVGLGGALLTCVVPYLVPDGVKLWLAWLLSRRMERHLKIG